MPVLTFVVDSSPWVRIVPKPVLAVRLEPVGSVTCTVTAPSFLLVKRRHVLAVVTVSWPLTHSTVALLAACWSDSLALSRGRTVTVDSVTSPAVRVMSPAPISMVAESGLAVWKVFIVFSLVNPAGEGLAAGWDEAGAGTVGSGAERSDDPGVDGLILAGGRVFDALLE